MIIGIGVDLVDLGRFARALGRVGFAERVFSPAELSGAPSVATAGRRAEYFGGRFAAKEALAKALGAPGGLKWLDAEVVSGAVGKPEFRLRGTVLARAAALGVGNLQLSISHDAKTAVAFVVLDQEAATVKEC